MVYNTQNHSGSGICPTSRILKTIRGDVSGIRCFPLFTRGWKQTQFPKRCVFQFLEFRTMDKVQNPSNSECYIVVSWIHWRWRYCKKGGHMQKSLQYNYSISYVTIIAVNCLELKAHTPRTCYSIGLSLYGAERMNRSCFISRRRTGAWQRTLGSVEWSRREGPPAAADFVCSCIFTHSRFYNIWKWQ
jgi:hypothetical protein